MSSDDGIPCAGSKWIDVYPRPRSGGAHNKPPIGGSPVLTHVLEQVVTEILWNLVVLSETRELPMLEEGEEEDEEEEEE